MPGTADEGVILPDVKLSGLFHPGQYLFCVQVEVCAMAADCASIATTNNNPKIMRFILFIMYFI